MSSSRRVVALLLWAAAFVTGTAAHGADRSGDETDLLLAQALEQIEKLVASSNSGPGIAIGITDRDRVRGIIVHGHADLKAKVPVSADTKFAIGSLSKSFTAVTLLQLLDEGKFDPAAPVSRYLPQFRVDSKYPQMTGHSLLNHTSGLPNYLPHLSSMRYVVHALHDFQPSYAPGEHFQYSNTGYQVLGYVVERIEGETFASVLKRRVLDRLGMRASLPQMDDATRQSLAISYQRWPYDGSYVEANWFPYTAADGAIASTPADVCAYIRFLLNRGALPSGRLLSEAAFRKLITPGLDNYAYGVDVSEAAGRTVVGHSGAIYGFNSYLQAHIDEGFGLIFLSNGTLGGELIGRVIGVVSTAFGGDGKPVGFRSFAPKAAYSLTDGSNYAGSYRRQDGAEITFLAAPDGNLFLHRPDNNPIRLMKMGRDTYGANEVGAYLFFRGREHPERGVQEVSHGADWYAKDGSAGDSKFAAPAEYRAYVGRYRNHSDEGPDVRVFVRRGRLMLAPVADSSYSSELEPMGAGAFRLASPAQSPERYQFDTLDEGVTLRLQMTGVPLYRVDMP